MNDEHDNAQTDREMLEKHGEVLKWADAAMYRSEPMPEEALVGPRVHLLSMTTDPLGVVAAGSMMYEGKVVRSLADVTDEQRRHYFDQITKTHLKAPFELVDFHFMIEGVTRSFTHQMVRQRTAVFMQESLRFAVKENLDAETPLPPSLAGLKDDDPSVRLWRKGINTVQDIYEALVDSGIPAEDARGLLPHQTTTRLHYKTNLRNLQEHAGMRLCTQAQFEWRNVWLQIVDAIRKFPGEEWQQDYLANLFRPVCYLTGKCEFNATFDRACRIKERVQANHAIGRPSSEWGEEYFGVPAGDSQGYQGNGVSYLGMPEEGGRPVIVEGIHPAEWLAMHDAARVAPGS